MKGISFLCSGCHHVGGFQLLTLNFSIPVILLEFHSPNCLFLIITISLKIISDVILIVGLTTDTGFFLESRLEEGYLCFKLLTIGFLWFHFLLNFLNLQSHRSAFHWEEADIFLEKIAQFGWSNKKFSQFHKGLKGRKTIPNNSDLA